MSNLTDIAKMEYAMTDPDDIRKAGKTRAYTYTRNGRNKTADTILYEKNIGTKSYYGDEGQYAKVYENDIDTVPLGQ